MTVDELREHLAILEKRGDVYLTRDVRAAIESLGQDFNELRALLAEARTWLDYLETGELIARIDAALSASAGKP